MEVSVCKVKCWRECRREIVVSPLSLLNCMVADCAQSNASASNVARESKNVVVKNGGIVSYKVTF